MMTRGDLLLVTCSSMIWTERWGQMGRSESGRRCEVTMQCSRPIVIEASSSTSIAATGILSCIIVDHPTLGSFPLREVFNRWTANMMSNADSQCSSRSQLLLAMR